jgi:hypothetical protein
MHILTTGWTWAVLWSVLLLLDFGGVVPIHQRCARIGTGAPFSTGPTH